MFTKVHLEGLLTRTVLVLFGLCIVAGAAAALAGMVQTDFGAVYVSNVHFSNKHGVPVRAKLLRPKAVTVDAKAPGAVFIPGYQSIREDGDAVAIELARRGFVVLAIDTIGRGNSGVPPPDVNDPTFDPTFGGRAALAYIRSLPYVNRNQVAMTGHSLGAQMAYAVGLSDPTVRAVVMIGSAYDEKVTTTKPANLLMVFGTIDEFRQRMTGTKHFAAEWMQTSETRAAFGIERAAIGTTVGDFAQGTARRIVAPVALHLTELHHPGVVAEVAAWLKQALTDTEAATTTDDNQIWPIKEWTTLVAMLAGLAALFPLALLLVGKGPLSDCRMSQTLTFVCPKRDFFRASFINGMLMWFYLPASIVIFAIHKYVVKIDGVFPMMVVNVVVLWLLVTNLVGFFLFRRWVKRHPVSSRALLFDLGVAFHPETPGIDWRILGKHALLGAVLFGFAYGLEALLETFFLVDYRFIISFANDLTGYRWLMFLLYFPMFFIGLLQMGVFYTASFAPHHAIPHSRPSSPGPSAGSSSWPLPWCSLLQCSTCRSFWRTPYHLRGQVECLYCSS